MARPCSRRLRIARALGARSVRTVADHVSYAATSRASWGSRSAPARVWHGDRVRAEQTRASVCPRTWRHTSVDVDRAVTCRPACGDWAATRARPPGGVGRLGRPAVQSVAPTSAHCNLANAKPLDIPSRARVLNGTSARAFEGRGRARARAHMRLNDVLGAKEAHRRASDRFGTRLQSPRKGTKKKCS